MDEFFSREELTDNFWGVSSPCILTCALEYNPHAICVQFVCNWHVFRMYLPLIHLIYAFICEAEPLHIFTFIHMIYAFICEAEPLHIFTFRPRLHWNGSKRIRTSMGTVRPSVYTGPVGSVPVRIRYPYQFGIAFQSVPVWIRSS